MGLTCHFIDEFYCLHKRVIAFRVFDDPHTARNIARIIYNILTEYRLVQRVFSISFDNASANTASISDLTTYCRPQIGGKFFHIRCAAHILNLCVQDGLQYISEVVKPIRFILKYLWSHPTVRKEWARFCKQNGAHPKRFPRDVCHRWNSTYEMISESYDYRDLLSSFASQHIPDADVFGETWVIANDVMDVFKVFNDATYTFSHVYKPTSNLFCYTALNIAGALDSGLKVPNIVDAVMAMRTKWLAYYKVIPDVFLVAFVFDPRYKLTGLQDLLESYFPLLGLEEDDPLCDVDAIVLKVRRTLEELFNHYSSLEGGNDDAPLPPAPSSSARKGKSIFASAIFCSKRARTSGSGGSSMSSSGSELDKYLTTFHEFSQDDLDDEEYNVLQWWSKPDRQGTYRILSKIARQILAVPASTVAIEQTFSQGGQILDPKRSNLMPETLEALVCVNDWKRAEMLAQKNINSSTSDPNDDDGTSSVGSSSCGSESDQGTDGDHGVA